MVWIPKAQTRGPAGYNATGAAEDAAALAAFTRETAGPNEFAAALSATVMKDKRSPTDGALVAKVTAGTTQVVALSGHSQMYGQSEAGALPPLTENGGWLNRSINNIPDVLAEALNLLYPGLVTIQNNSVSGMSTSTWLSGFAANRPHGSLEIVWLDSNDFALDVPVAQMEANLTAIAEKILDAGSQPVFIGSQFAQERPVTVNRQARAAITRRVAERYGTRYIDASELLNGFADVNNLWTDGVHLNDSAFGMIGGRLMSIFGPKGLNPMRVGPSSIIRPNHQTILGGAVTARGAALNGRTIRLTAGQTAMVPIDVNSPCDAIVRFYTDNGTAGVGTGRIRYALGKAGVPDRRVSTSATHSATAGFGVRGHTHRGGLDVIYVTCDTGSLEVEGIDFTEARPNLRPAILNQNKTVTTRLSGIVLAPLEGDPYAKVSDTGTPISTVTVAGGIAWRADFSVTFGAGTGTSSQALFLAADLERDQAWLGFRCGFAIRRGTGGAELILRQFNADASVVNLLIDPAFFVAGAAWSGVFSIVGKADGTAQVYANGAAVGPAFPLVWKHFTVGAYAGPGPALSVQGVTITAPPECV